MEDGETVSGGDNPSIKLLKRILRQFSSGDKFQSLVYRVIWVEDEETTLGVVVDLLSKFCI